MWKHDKQSKQPDQSHERMHCLIDGLGKLSHKIKKEGKKLKCGGGKENKKGGTEDKMGSWSTV